MAIESLYGHIKVGRQQFGSVSFLGEDGMMLDHPQIQQYALEDIPRDRDLFMMDVKWEAEYERYLLNGLAGGDWEPVGFISYIAVRSANEHGLELSWYPNTADRFHEIRCFLPRSKIVRCVGCWEYDEKPHLFVESDWYEDIYQRTNSVFAIVDAIGVRQAIQSGAISQEQLTALRDGIDELSRKNPRVAFVSFADSVLVKANWHIGTWDTETEYDYAPELVFRILPEIVRVYRDTLGLGAYAVAAQGRNEFYPDELLHTSDSGNHISMNSLGLPFAQIQAIEQTARRMIRLGEHGPADLYIDSNLYHSLKWQYPFEKHKEPFFPYLAPLSDTACAYVTISFDKLLKNLQPE